LPSLEGIHGRISPNPLLNSPEIEPAIGQQTVLVAKKHKTLVSGILAIDALGQRGCNIGRVLVGEDQYWYEIVSRRA